MKYTEDRRTFLKTIGVGVLGATMAPFLRVLPVFAASGMVKTSAQKMLMGTMVQMTVVTDSKDQGVQAMEAAFAEMQRQIAIFDRYDSATPVSILNQNGQLRDAPRELLEVVDFSSKIHGQTGGQFDVTIAPVVNLLQSSQGKPQAQDLKEALSLVDGQQLRIQGSTLSLGAQDMAVTFDGVAKGYIADGAAQVLTQEGVHNFLINAGGDIHVRGAADGLHRPWRVAIEDPEKQGHYPTIVDMTAGAVATSGGYEIFFDRGRKSTHLLSPATGKSPQYVRSVSVQAPTVHEADAWATALSLMRPQDALRQMAALPGHSCFLVTSSGAHLSSATWNQV